MQERRVAKRYTLTMLREGGYYTPMTEDEFEEFKRENPEVALYFETDDEGQPVKPISELDVPEVPETAPIFDHWEKAA